MAQGSNSIGKRMQIDDELKPKQTDAQWTWPKIAMVLGTIFAMLALLLIDFESR